MSELLGEHLNVVQRTLNDLELDRILASRLFGRVRLFELNRTYQHYGQLRELLRHMGLADPKTFEIVSRLRRRPRRAGKPL
jgi:hypothetical protein